MRLEDWRKWLEEQFLDRNPPATEDTGRPDELSKTETPTLVPQPPPPVSGDQEPVPLAQENLRPPVSSPDIPAARPPQTAWQTPQASVPKVHVSAASGPLSVEVPHIEEYLPFLRPRRPADVEPAASVPTPQPAVLPQQRAAQQEPDTTATPAAPATTVPVQTDVTTAPQAEAVVAPAVVEAPRRAEVAEVESPRAAPESFPTQPEVRATATPVAPHDKETRREELVPAPAAPPEVSSATSSSSPVRKRRARSAKHVTPPELAPPLSSDDFWKLAPRHIRTLIAMGQDEGVQRSYRRPFKESRLALIERLLDPTLSLEETARLLNVCPATVRRYTNRGQLRHFRTEGDQRRFRLSDVLAFMEAQMSEQQDRADSR